MRSLAALMILGAAAHAATVYKVEFELRDANQPAQRFTVPVDETGKGSLRGMKRISAGSPAQDVEVGATIQCELKESAGKAALHAEVELSRITGEAILGAISQPIIGQRKLSFDVTAGWSAPQVVDGLKGTQVQVTVVKLP
jgi:hypothetical protein